MAGEAEKIGAWVVDAALGGHTQTQLIEGYCDRLLGAGVPIWRVSIGAERLHPLIDAQGQRWLAGKGVYEETFRRKASPEEEAQWLNSPWNWMIENHLNEMRLRLAQGEGTNQFPLFASLAAEGGTDYFSRIMPFADQFGLAELRGLAASWTTREPGGFRQHDLDLINATFPTFALASKASMAQETALTIVTTYLGKAAAERIMRGEIERGKVTNVRKVLWLSDLKGFTRMADTLARDQLLELLNAYTDCLVGIVEDHGGEVLKFMGDGFLAEIGGEEIDACRRALDAAQSAIDAVAALNRNRLAAGRPVTDFTLALHAGEVLYGNIGSEQRLDFTVVGPAVNEASRIQGMCRSLDQPILISSSFADACRLGRDRLVSVGRYSLRGVERPQELFTLERNSTT